MSHIVEAKTSISHPDATLLLQAISLVADQHEAEVLENREVRYMGRKYTGIGLQVSGLYQPLNVIVEEATGELKFLVDYWGAQELVEQIQRQIVQSYVSLATLKALQQLGYTTNIQEAGAGQVILTGVTYA